MVRSRSRTLIPSCSISSLAKRFKGNISIGSLSNNSPWDEEDRAHRRAKLDALFFHLYGVTDRQCN